MFCVLLFLGIFLLFISFSSCFEGPLQFSSVLRCAAAVKLKSFCYFPLRPSCPIQEKLAWNSSSECLSVVFAQQEASQHSGGVLQGAGKYLNSLLHGLGFSLDEKRKDRLKETLCYSPGGAIGAAG